MDVLYVLVLIFATSSGLVCIYSLVSSYLLFMSMTKLSSNEEFYKLVTSLFITVFVGFVYTLWNLLTQIGLVNVGNNLVTSLISNLLISLFFVMLAYLAFLTRQLSGKYGFKKVGNEINQYLAASKVKKGKRKAR